MHRLLVLMSVSAIALPDPAVSVAQQAPAAVRVGVPETGVASSVQADFSGFDDFVRSVMEKFRVPGLAVAAIKDGEVVLSKGYGYRNVEQQSPITPRTLLAIGSNSKSFTAMILGMLVEEGKLDWDEPLRTYLPDFHLYDEGATAEFTPRDLVIHRSGLPRHDLLWYGRSYAREDLYQRLRYLEPTTSFRGRWQYQNLMFMTAGILAERLTHKPWEQLVRERILEPLGMARTNFSVDDSQRSDDHALPYMMIDDELTAVPFRNIDAIGPAGSINSNVEEMIRYIEMNINQGEYDSTQIISEETAAEMQRPHSTASGEWEYPELGYRSYGMGLSVTSYQGRKLVQHGGGIDGFISSMSWMPREKIGVVVLTNLSGFNPVPNIVKWNVYDRLLAFEEVDWLSRIRKEREEFEENQAKEERERTENQKSATSPSHDLSAYAGRYEHPAYGTVEVANREGTLTITLDLFRGELEHYHYDIFEVEAPPGNAIDDMLVTFMYNKEGEIDRLLMPLDSNVEDIIFTKEMDDEEGR
jgi:CubicO group peptidase (beta-lactamase class C family)